MIVKSLEMTQMEQLLERSAAWHRHLCPRQVLGVRMGLLAGRVLGLDIPHADRRLLTLAETDGCAADGLSVATGCTVGNRRLRVLDFGKVAATFVDMRCEKSYRIAPRKGIRSTAQRLVPDAKSRWHAQLKAYQTIPELDLLTVQQVELSISLEKLLSKPGYRINCESCGEEIINEREVNLGETVLCRACAGQSYYQLAEQDRAQALCNDKVKVLPRSAVKLSEIDVV
jgi:formylmethanofuran dehydrogenase subunit E